MKRYFILSIIFLAFTINLSAQNPLVKQWDYRFGGTHIDAITSFQQTNDGGYILGGYSFSVIGGDKTQNTWGSFDYWIVKIDSIGNKQWDKDFGGNGDDELLSLQQTIDGGYILGGYSNSDSSGDKTQNTWGSYDYWIVKIDSLGNKQWDKDFGGTADDLFLSLQQTVDGGYILGGWSISDSSGDKSQPSWGASDYWIIKIDSLGNKQWDKDFGGSGFDQLYSLQQTTDGGGYILGGFSLSNISGDKTQNSWGLYDYWIVKVDSFGNKQWDRDFGGTDYDQLLSLQQTADEGYILGGWSNSGISPDKTQNTWGGYDYWIIKIDSLGNKQWDKDFGGTDDEFGNVFQTTDGGYLMAGTSYSPISGNKTEVNLGQQQSWIVKTDSLGNMQWDKTIFTLGHDEAGLAIQSKDGCYVIANYTQGGIGGYKTQPSWNNSTDYWIIKFCDTTSTVGINAPNNPPSVSIYPNPFEDQLHVSVNSNQPAEIVLYDMLSRKLLQQEFMNSVSLSTSQLAPGIYICEIRNNKGVVKKLKVVKG